MMREVMQEALTCPGMGEDDEQVQQWAEYLAEDEQILAETLRKGNAEASKQS